MSQIDLLKTAVKGIPSMADNKLSREKQPQTEAKPDNFICSGPVYCEVETKKESLEGLSYNKSLQENTSAALPSVVSNLCSTTAAKLRKKIGITLPLVF